MENARPDTEEESSAPEDVVVVPLVPEEIVYTFCKKCESIIPVDLRGEDHLRVNCPKCGVTVDVDRSKLSREALLEAAADAAARKKKRG